MFRAIGWPIVPHPIGEAKTGGSRVLGALNDWERHMTAEYTIRVTHLEREKTVEGLRVAYAMGCLDGGELEELSGLAYTAKTRGALADLVSDLPPLPADSRPDVAPPRSGDRSWRALG